MVETYSKDFNELVAALYRGPFEASHWSVFLDLLSEQTEADHTVLGLSQPRPDYPGIAFSNNKGAEEERYAYGDIAHLNPFINLPDCQAMTLHELGPIDEILSSTYYKNYLLPKDYVYLLGCDIYHNGQMAIYVRSIRGASSSDFSESDKTLFNRLAPHFKNLVLWLDNREKLLSEKTIYEEVISRLSLGTILINSIGYIEKLNPVAEFLLESCQELSIKGGRLFCSKRSLNDSLKTMLPPKTNNKNRLPSLSQSLVIPRSETGTPIYLVVKPKITNTLSSDSIEAHYIVFLSAPELNTIGQEKSLKEMLGLTKAETRVAIQLSNGLSVSEISEKLDLSVNTIRTHIARSYRKTGVNRQAALIKLVLRCIASLS